MVSTTDSDVNIIVNDSLAKGLANRAARDFNNLVQAQINKLNSTPKYHRLSANGRYKNLCAVVCNTFKETIIAAQEVDLRRKKRRYFIFLWSMEGRQLYFWFIIIPFNPNHDVTIVEVLKVTRHAIERIFERLNTTDFSDVVEELLHCALFAAGLQFTGIEVDTGEKGLECKTNTGKAILNRKHENDIWSVITWVEAKPGSLNVASEYEITLREKIGQPQI